MCRLFGVIYGPGGPQAEEWTPTEFASLMFPASVHGGPHAFGWMSFNPADGITYNKYSGNVTHKRNAAKVSLDDECRWFVGHVRWATNGDPKHEWNNHPIPHRDVIGVHNGVLKDWQPILDVTGREDVRSEVDSEAIFAAVAEWGVDEGLERVEGSAVAVFANTAHPEVVHIARTHSKSVYYATTPAGSLIFASEPGIIEATGIILANPIVEFTGRFRRMEIAEGRIRLRKGFRVDPTPPPTKRRTSLDVPAPLPNGVRVQGITDWMGTATSTPSRRRRNRKRRSSEPVFPVNVNGTAIGFTDQWGGKYMGAGYMERPDGEVVSVADYVNWAVQQESARLEHLAMAEADEQFRAMMAAEAAERGE